MKIILIIVSVILAGVIGAGGYFIYSLSGQVNDLETRLGLKLAQSFNELENTLNETAGKLAEADFRLEGALASNNETISHAIADTNNSLTAYAASAGGRFTEIESDIMGANSQITNLQTIAEDTQNVLNSSVLQSQELYEKVHEAIVTISDGTHLLGSGFLVSFPTGGKFVVTAYHVVKGAPVDWVQMESGVCAFPKLYITLYDGSTWQASFASRSEDADIAIMAATTRPDMTSYNSEALPTVTLSNSGDVKVGDPVFVVGCPDDYEDYRLGLEETINTGVISQINRGATVGNKYVADMLQFDAAANFGNSGSPLFNADGDVIGVVIGRINPLLGDGVSFAVKSSQIMKVWSKVIPGEWGGIVLSDETQSPMYEYPWTGLTIRDNKPNEMFTSDNTLPDGTKVISVTGPASTAGIMAGDIITMIDDLEVTNSDEFYSFLVEYYAPGDSVILQIIRGEEELTITLEVQEKP